MGAAASRLHERGRNVQSQRRCGQERWCGHSGPSLAEPRLHARGCVGFSGYSEWMRRTRRSDANARRAEGQVRHGLTAVVSI